MNETPEQIEARMNKLRDEHGNVPRDKQGQFLALLDKAHKLREARGEQP